MCGLSGVTEIDVLIVGLGPAGAAAGAAAARSGCSVVALERNANRGLPVQCAEFVPLIINAGEDVASIGHATVQNIDRMETFVEASDADITLDFRGQMIDRAEFDRFLIARAEASGVQCWFSSPVRDITEDGLVQTADGRQFKAKVIIGADGPRSPVAAAIGASNEDLVETRQITVPLHKAHDATDIFLSADILGGYGWLFPKGDVANLGLGLIPSEKHQLKPLLEQLHARLIEEGRVGEQVLSHTGGNIG